MNQKQWNRLAGKKGRHAYAKARRLGYSVAKAGDFYTAAFVEIWKKSPAGVKSATRYTYSEKKKAANRRFLYGLSDREFQAKLRKQKKKCAICKKKFRKTPHVDHEEVTKKCRGLLCSKCNFLIGLADEDIQILKNAIKYLRRY